MNDRRPAQADELEEFDLAMEQGEGALEEMDDGFEGFEAAEEDEAAEELGFESEDEFSGEASFDVGEDGFDEFGDEALAFAEYEGEGDEIDALEEAMVDALDAEDSDEFLGTLLGGVGRLAGLIGRGAGAAGQVARVVGGSANAARRVAGAVMRGARAVDRVAGRAGALARRSQAMAGRAQHVAGRVGRYAQRAAQAQSPLGYLMQLLGQHLNQPASQADEMEAFDEVADWYAEEEADAAIPVLAGLAARTIARPLMRAGVRTLSRPIRRALVRTASQAARTLVRRGPAAVRALPRVARVVARQVAQRRVPVAAAPRVLRRAAAQVAARPRVLRRLARPAPSVIQGGGVVQARSHIRQIRLRGPVQITISGR